MAAQITLVRRDDFVADVESLSLWNYTAGYSIAPDGWAIARPAPTDERVAETLTIQTKAAGPNTLAADLQPLDVFLSKVAWYDDPQELYGVWLRVQQPRETNARQALITKAALDKIPLWSTTAQDGPGGAAAYGTNFVAGYGLALERMPYWEGTASVDYSGLTALSTVGGQGDYTTYGGSPGAVAGDVPARLAQVGFLGVNGGGGPLVKFWLGFRTNRFGNRANFVPNWRLESGGVYDSDTSANGANADANTKFGFKTITTFATVATILQRVKMAVLTAAVAHPVDQRGTFLVLLRARIAAAGQVNVRLTDGLYQNTTFAVRDRVAITSTSWQYYEMGVVRIPSPGREIASLDMVSYYAMGIDAELVTGTPSTTNLEMDCLTLIPIGEGWCSADVTNTFGYGTQYSLGDTMPTYVQERPDGTKASALVIASHPEVVGAVRLGGGLPVGNGIAVVAAQRNGVSTLADTVTLDLQVYNRWVTMRGAS